MAKKEITKLAKLKKFIKENALNFEGTGSDLNSNLTTLCGFALFIGMTQSEEVVKAIPTPGGSPIPVRVVVETKKVFNYAKRGNYQHFWSTPEAEEQYRFDK